MQRFCRHNRFVERCPICRETVPGLAPPEKVAGNGGRRTEKRATAGTRAGASAAQRKPRRGRGAPTLRVRQERRAEDDGYRSELAPGLRSSLDAERLAQEIAFADGRLMAIRTAPPDLYGEMRELEDLEQASWMGFLAAYLCPLEGPDPFLGVRRALQADWRAGELPDLSEIPLGPRSSHDPARGEETLLAYLQWKEHSDAQAGAASGASGGASAAAGAAFVGDPGWTPTRRFERLFERLTLPGLGRMGRYDLLVTLGRIGLYELSTDSLFLGAARGGAGGDLTSLAAKRLFGIGELQHLERRAQALAREMSVPVEALDLAFANWGAGERATVGAPPEVLDQHALDRARAALEL
ncbi:MAG TPA: hypothetical protein VMS02_02385 [Solirubrobacteraceae bacterium]|nr:hypothetical protein [Solirubrobacteraceae bacterium]